MTSNTTTIAERALAEYRAGLERQRAERNAIEAQRENERRAARAEINAAAIAAHGWLFDEAGATYDAEADLIRTDDGLMFEANARTLRGAPAPTYELYLMPACSDCGAAERSAEINGQGWPVTDLMDLGAMLDLHAQAPVVCRACREAQYAAWLETEDDDTAAEAPDPGPGVRPARIGWVYLPTRRQWINGAAIESVSIEDSGAELFVIYTTPGEGHANQGTEYVRDGDDVRALTRWLEDWA